MPGTPVSMVATLVAGDVMGEEGVGGVAAQAATRTLHAMSDTAHRRFCVMACRDRRAALATSEERVSMTSLPPECGCLGHRVPAPVFIEE